MGLNRTFDLEVELSRIYRFRYRAANVIGYSVWSEHTHILAAYVPEKPPSRPEVVSVSASEIVL